MREGGFYPRVPCGTRPRDFLRRLRAERFLPTRPLRDATLDEAAEARRLAVSTHASLAGRDRPLSAIAALTQRFYPRVPCGTRLHGAAQGKIFITVSTHASLAGRDGRGGLRRGKDWTGFLPTRPLRDATVHGIVDALEIRVSTHASLAGRDPSRLLTSATLRRFYPRVPCGTRQSSPLSAARCRVSTHASLAGRDLTPE